MSNRVAGHQTDSYRIETDVYEGPLDLLLELIQKMELDITSVALAQVTDQYLGYLHNLQQQDAGQVSAFLVIAAKLLQIKSESLLPRPVVREVGEEDPGETLAQQLMLYRIYKQAAEWLLNREFDHLKTYLHTSSQPKSKAKPVPGEISLSELIGAALSVFSIKSDMPILSDVVSIPKITIREKIQTILDTLHSQPTTTFNELVIKNRSRIEVVITFLAILELIKRHIIDVRQSNLFANIELQLIHEWNPPDEFELEFEE